MGVPGLLAAAVPADVDSATHQPLRVEKGNIQVDSKGDTAPLDNVSDYCLDCHTEASGSKPSHPTGHADGSHPVDVIYPAKKNESFVPTAELDQRLLLLGGRVTCITCHDPQTTDHSLVIPTEGSQICIACHRL
jgi:predicted CXXCH cytochrome family protein